MADYRHTPTVSVFMPTYNQEHLISEAIESVLAQDYDDWELIIGDDCSTDKTFQIANQYQQKHPEKIFLFQNFKNLGITKNFNNILKKCTGKYVAFFAGDDIYLPNKLSNQVSLMLSSKDIVLSYHDIEVFDSCTNKTIRYWNSGNKGCKPITGNSQTVAKALVKEGTKFMSALSVMVKREAIPPEGHDERIPIASDWLLWIEICARNQGEIAYLDGVYARYRRHENNITNDSKNHLEDIYVTLALVESRYHYLTKYAQQRRARLYYKRAKQQFENTNYKLTRSLIKENIKHSRLSWKVIQLWSKSIYKQFLQ